LQSGTAISESETILFKKLLSLKLGDRTKTFNANDRQILLKILVEYYAMHLDNFRKPKSIEILRDVFS
jgi:DNA repair protein RecO (recombination protein O)